MILDDTDDQPFGWSFFFGGGTRVFCGRRYGLWFAAGIFLVCCRYLLVQHQSMCNKWAFSAHTPSTLLQKCLFPTQTLATGSLLRNKRVFSAHNKYPMRRKRPFSAHKKIPCLTPPCNTHISPSHFAPSQDEHIRLRGAAPRR